MNWFFVSVLVTFFTSSLASSTDLSPASTMQENLSENIKNDFLSLYGAKFSKEANDCGTNPRLLEALLIK